MKGDDKLAEAIRTMIRQEIDATPGFRELLGRSKLPHNADAERTILGAVMLDNALLQTISLGPEAFCLASHRTIWATMQAMKGSIDLVTLQEALGGSLASVGGVAYLCGLTEGLPRRPAVQEYVQIVGEKHRLRRIMAACQTALEACMDQQRPAAEIVEEMGNALKGIKGGKK